MATPWIFLKAPHHMPLAQLNYRSLNNPASLQAFRNGSFKKFASAYGFFSAFLESVFKKSSGFRSSSFHSSRTCSIQYLPSLSPQNLALERS
jgi:hypothetical protein